GAPYPDGGLPSSDSVTLFILQKRREVTISLNPWMLAVDLGPSNPREVDDGVTTKSVCVPTEDVVRAFSVCNHRDVLTIQDVPRREFPIEFGLQQGCPFWIGRKPSCWKPIQDIVCHFFLYHPNGANLPEHGVR
ncbi:MAG: hypothetical protein WCS01_14670, partial [bacterium]